MHVRIYILHSPNIDLFDVHSIIDAGRYLYFTFLDGSSPKKLDKSLAQDMMVKWNDSMKPLES